MMTPAQHAARAAELLEKADSLVAGVTSRTYDASHAAAALAVASAHAHATTAIALSLEPLATALNAGRVYVETHTTWENGEPNGTQSFVYVTETPTTKGDPQ